MGRSRHSPQPQPRHLPGLRAPRGRDREVVPWLMVRPMSRAASLCPRGRSSQTARYWGKRARLHLCETARRTSSTARSSSLVNALTHSGPAHRRGSQCADARLNKRIPGESLLYPSCASAGHPCGAGARQAAAVAPSQTLDHGRTAPDAMTWAPPSRPEPSSRLVPSWAGGSDMRRFGGSGSDSERRATPQGQSGLLAASG